MKDDQQDSGDQGRSARDGVQSWDRVGQFLGRASEAGTRISQRNLDLWNRVSENLRDTEYNSDKMAADGARAVATAMQNIEDAWGVWFPSGQVGAGGLPLVVLTYEPMESGGYVVPDAVEVAAPPSGTLPRLAKVALTGGPDLELMQRSIHVIRSEDKRTYTIEAVAEGPLRPGAYAGLAYLPSPRNAVPLADLRVVVVSPAA